MRLRVQTISMDPVRHKSGKAMPRPTKVETPDKSHLLFHLPLTQTSVVEPLLLRPQNVSTTPVPRLGSWIRITRGRCMHGSKPCQPFFCLYQSRPS